MCIVEHMLHVEEQAPLYCIVDLNRVFSHLLEGLLVGLDVFSSTFANSKSNK